MAGIGISGITIVGEVLGGCGSGCESGEVGAASMLSGVVASDAPL